MKTGIKRNFFSSYLHNIINNWWLIIHDLRGSGYANSQRTRTYAWVFLFTHVPRSSSTFHKRRSVYCVNSILICYCITTVAGYHRLLMIAGHAGRYALAEDVPAAIGLVHGWTSMDVIIGCTIMHIDVQCYMDRNGRTRLWSIHSALICCVF